MMGKILGVKSNDIYGKSDDREVIVFAVFNHLKYMNKYVAFCFKNELDKNKLYFGSIHLKENSIVIFNCKEEVKELTTNFISEYLENKLEEFELVDISNMEKVEIVSYNEMEYKKLDELYKKSIYIEQPITEEVTKKSGTTFLIILLVILIIMLIGIIYIKNNPEILTSYNKMLDCNGEFYNKELKLKYNSNRVVKFDNKDRISSIKVSDSYKFNNLDNYLEFRDNEKHMEKFPDGESYRYVDDNLELIIFYNDKTIIDSYEEMLTYLTKSGYSCKEDKYEG